MNHKPFNLRLCLAGLSVTALLLGCRPSDPQPVAGTNAPPAAPSTNGLTWTERRDEFVAGANQALKDLDQELADLGQKAGNYKDEAKTNADKLIEDLRVKRVETARKLDELKKSTAEAWSQNKTNITAALHDLQDGFENAKSRFK